MATSVETDPTDCQMQPLDLSCPKVRRHSSDSSEDCSPRSSFEGSSRPRSSTSGHGSDEDRADIELPSESSSHNNQNNSRRNLASIHSVLRNGWPFPHPVLALGVGPARKRFLTKYLHKENGENLFKNSFIRSFCNCIKICDMCHKLTILEKTTQNHYGFDEYHSWYLQTIVFFMINLF